MEEDAFRDSNSDMVDVSANNTGLEDDDSSEDEFEPENSETGAYLKHLEHKDQMQRKIVCQFCSFCNLSLYINRKKSCACLL